MHQSFAAREGPPWARNRRSELIGALPLPATVAVICRARLRPQSKRRKVVSLSAGFRLADCPRRRHAAAARNEKGVSCISTPIPVHQVRRHREAERLLEIVPGDAGPQAGINFRAVIRGGEIPHLGLGSPPSGPAIASSGCTWSDSLSCASRSLAKMGKRGRVPGMPLAEDFSPMISPQSRATSVPAKVLA